MLKVPVVDSKSTVVPLVTELTTIPVAPLPTCVNVSPADTLTFPVVVIVTIVPKSKY